jgi:hypothetical protein
MRFIYDEALDVVEAFFEGWELKTAEDVVAWRREVEKELGRFGRKVDLLINLDGLVVRPRVSKFFGEERAEVLARYTTRSFRYGGDPWTRTAVFTSAVRWGADANVYPSREAAVAALLAARRTT